MPDGSEFHTVGAASVMYDHVLYQRTNKMSWFIRFSRGFDCGCFWSLSIVSGSKNILSTCTVRETCRVKSLSQFVSVTSSLYL